MKYRANYFSFYLLRYVALEIFISFFIGTFLFLLVLLMFQGIRLSEFIVVHQVSIKNVLLLVTSLMVSFLPIAIPIAFLFSVLIGISRSNSESEIIGLQANGLSLRQVFLPVGLFSALITAWCLYLSLFTVPKGNRSFELMIAKLTNERIISVLKAGVFENFFGMTLFAERVIPARNEIKKVFIYDERDEASPLSITAQEGILRHDPEQGMITLRLTRGAILVDSKIDKPVQEKINFDVYDVNLPLPEVAEGWRDFSLPSLNYFQLNEKIAAAVHDPAQQRHLLVELHRRIALSFSCIIFAFLGFTIGLISQRGIRSSAIVICIVVALVYWLAYIFANALAAGGWIIPWIGIWLPNVFFVGVAWVFYQFRRYS